MNVESIGMLLMFRLMSTYTTTDIIYKILDKSAAKNDGKLNIS